MTPKVGLIEDTTEYREYHYYANDVFNDCTLPAGYTAVSGEAVIVTDEKSTPVDQAFRHHYTYSSRTTDQFMNATDGHPNTYWEATSSDKNADVHEVLLIGLNDQHKIENVAFENVYLELPGGYTSIPGWPSGVGSGYPEHYSAGGRSNAWAYCIKYADNVTFKNCVNILLSDDVREEITYYDGYSSKKAIYDSNIQYVMPVRLDKAAGTIVNGPELPDTVAVIVEFDEVITVPVKWQADGEYNLSEDGTYTYNGVIEDIDGVRNPQGLTAKATVTVSGSAGGTTTSPATSDAAVAVALGSALSLAGMAVALATKKRKSIR